MQSKSRFPHSLVLIFLLIVLAQLATYLLPAGEFTRVPDAVKASKMVVVPGTYAAVDAEPLPWHAFLTLIPKGMEAGADIIFFVFIVGGVIGVVRATGAIDALIGSTLKHFGGKPVLLVGGMMTLFAIGASTIGMTEEYMPFVPLLVTMCIALRMDAVVALGVIYIGAGVGYGCAAFNPFTVMIAQRIAGVEIGSGQGLRWTLLAICIAVGVHHVMRYAARIRADPSRSLVAGIDYSSGFEMPKDLHFSAARAAILVLFAVAIGVFVYGINEYGWYLTELSATFFVVALISAVIARLSPNKVASEFCSGAAEMTTTALLIGFARTIEQMLTEGRVIDTVVHGLAQPLQECTPDFAAIGMLAVQSVTNFFIPSGSGQAYVTMPIMTPLADVTGVSRDVAVLAFQFGDGFTNMIVPTNALLMGMLALGRIPFERWARFIVPLLLKIYVVAVLAIVIAVHMGF